VSWEYIPRATDEMVQRAFVVAFSDTETALTDAYIAELMQCETLMRCIAESIDATMEEAEGEDAERGLALEVFLHKVTMFVACTVYLAAGQRLPRPGVEEVELYVGAEGWDDARWGMAMENGEAFLRHVSAKLTAMVDDALAPFGLGPRYVVLFLADFLQYAFANEQRFPDD